MCINQQEYNEACDAMKTKIDNMVIESGHNGLAMAIAIGDGEISTILYQFQEMVNPAVKSLGIETKSLSQIFGVEISLTCS